MAGTYERTEATKARQALNYALPRYERLKAQLKETEALIASLSKTIEDDEMGRTNAA